MVIYDFQVCSDRALGHNFNAVTCESCKAFFRRNAISNKKFSCPFSNACEITTITRRFCQKCRLEKCFKVGMKKEYIMSDEDKELKRMKIEQNRNKRKLKNGDKSSEDDQEHPRSKKSIKIKEEWSPGSMLSPNEMDTQSDGNESDEGQTPERLSYITAESTATEIVEAITKVPQDASQVLQKLLKTQDDTLFVMSKIIQDPSQALILISHLIKNPSDGMLIISKMMSSPLDALTVFTQFMSSPTDALQIIFKIISSPKDVLQFMTELTKAPQDALEIMGRFMASPGDTLAGINRMIIKAAAPAEPQGNEATSSDSNENMIKSILEVNSVASPNSSVASPSSSFQSVITESSPQSVPSVNADYDSNNNNNNTDDYQQNTMKLLNEIIEDTSEKDTSFHANSIDSIINEAIKLEYDTPQMVSHMRSTNRELNEVEIMKIQELIDSNKALYAPVDEDLSNLVFGASQIKAEPGVDPNLIRVINLTAIAIRRLIKMSKKISGFKKMCQEDQIALLKVSSIAS